MTAEVGMRVLRGPHWQGGDADGGEGHLGTLRALLGDGQVRVLWDNGKEMTCKAGADGKYELRILDTAQVGVHHSGSRCAECGDRDIFGMLWRCVETSCPGCTLCPLCYVMDKHNTKHVFERIDTDGASGQQVKKRSISLKIRAMGIFPGAKVIRGPDWIWANQDGGPECVGEVIGYENVAPTSSRNMVRVEWSSSKITNSYRLGFQGNVDLRCVEETAGTYYYREHLPLVDTTGSGFSAPLPTTKSATTSSTSRPPSLQGGGGAVGGTGSGLREDMKVGDKVVIGVDKERLRELQSDFGGTTAGMIECIGKTGEVVSVTGAKGALQVKFRRISYRFNPHVLLKVPVVSVGDMVQICSDLDRAQVLNKRVGWKPEMDVTCGKVGKVVKIDDDGDVAVAFGRKVHLYAPACCEDAAGMRADELTSSSENSSNSGGTDSSSSEQGELHQKLMQMLGQMMQEDTKGSSRNDYSEMGQLFKAINRGDADAVKSVCMADTSLLTQVHRGMTLLIVACHEGQREVINILLDLGAPIDAQGDQGNTALGAALEGKKESIALLLLKKGASVHKLNSKQRSAAHIAAYNSQEEALQEIIKKGADVNHTDKFGDSPLHDAIEKENRECVEVLMKAPSLDLQLCNKKGFNMLQLACLRGNVHAVEQILKRDKSHIDDLMHGEFSALHIAVTNDHVECARLLIAEGHASLNIKGSQGLTALHLACNEAYPRCVELLLSYGADLNISADDGNTPLHLTVGTTSTQLRKNPSDALEKQEYGRRVQMACMLLEKGAYIDATNNNGAEPLRCCRPDAIQNGVKEFIEENPQLIKWKGGGRVNPTEQQLQEAVTALLGGMSGASKRELQEQCKQS